MTCRQAEVLRLLAAGVHPKQIAVRLGVRRSTVGSHLHGAYAALGVDTAAQAVARFVGGSAPAVRGAVTPFQRAYLAAFDGHLAAGGRRGESSPLMRVALAGMRLERG